MCVCVQDSIDALNRTQTRGIEGQLYNKVNELQEDLSMKKFDLRAKQIHLAAIRAQVSFMYGEFTEISRYTNPSLKLGKCVELAVQLFVAAFWS